MFDECFPSLDIFLDLPWIACVLQGCKDGVGDSFFLRGKSMCVKSSYCFAWYGSLLVSCMFIPDLNCILSDLPCQISKEGFAYHGWITLCSCKLEVSLLYPISHSKQVVTVVGDKNCPNLLLRKAHFKSLHGNIDMLCIPSRCSSFSLPYSLPWLRCSLSTYELT